MYNVAVPVRTYIRMARVYRYCLGMRRTVRVVVKHFASHIHSQPMQGTVYKSCTCTCKYKMYVHQLYCGLKMMSSSSTYSHAYGWVVVKKTIFCFCCWLLANDISTLLYKRGCSASSVGVSQPIRIAHHGSLQLVAAAHCTTGCCECTGSKTISWK